MSESSEMKPGDQKKAVETFDQLCTHLENHLGIQIPLYIRNILLNTGFDNRLTLGTLSENDVADLEAFARSDMYYRALQNNPCMKCSDYYGIYASQRDKFKIVPGHKRLLLCLADFLKQTSQPTKTNYIEAHEI